MTSDLQEQACWLLLAFESGLSTKLINDIAISWCRQHKRPLREFFAADIQQWQEVCQLGVKELEKLEQAREKRVGQAFLAEQLSHNQIHLLTVVDEHYPELLKSALKRNQAPPVLFYVGNLDVLEHTTIAIIGSRNAREEILAFTQEVARYLAENDVNVISGNARGVDRAAYDSAVSVNGYTTVVLPHGIRKLSNVQMRSLLPYIEAGKVLLLSQFHPDAPWTVGRAMERNKVVTALAKAVIVAESDIHGGTWDGANGALAQKRSLYVCQPKTFSVLPGNNMLIKKGGHAIPWPTEDLAASLSQLLNGTFSKKQEQLQVYEMPLLSVEQVHEGPDIDQEQIQKPIAVEQESTVEALDINQEQAEETVMVSKEQTSEQEVVAASQKPTAKARKQKSDAVKKEKSSSSRKKETQSKRKRETQPEQLLFSGLEKDS